MSLNAKADASPLHAAPRPDAGSLNAGRPDEPAAHCSQARDTRDGKAARRIWARRRWAAVAIIAVALLAALLLGEMSGRTALMLGGALLTFALSADRLDQFDE